jgi:TRAP-type C4-dicarboxylate transport system permease small subunit
LGPLLIPLFLILAFLGGIAGVVGLGTTGVVLLFRSLRGRTRSMARRVVGVLGASALLVTAFGCLLPLIVSMAKLFYDRWPR